MDWPSVPDLSKMLDAMGGDAPPPLMDLVRSRRRADKLADIEATTRTEVRRLAGRADGRGAPIAVGVGSRGIANLAAIVITAVDELRAAGYAPFVVPAMGSHGGATAEGQVAVLEEYGITPSSLGVPIRATMETVAAGDVDGVVVHVDRYVAEAGRALLVARVKPHTDFSGPTESGPAKMAAIGLGKQRGAQGIHSLGIVGLRDVMPRVGRIVAQRFLIGALAIVENDRDETASITGLRPDEIGAQAETALLEQARTHVPKLPFDRLDVLVIDRMGKDISGAGMDPNVIGRWMINGLDEPDPHPVRCITVLDLTDVSHGNATGIGLADFIPRRLAAKIEPVVTSTNLLTSGWAGLQRARLPMVFDNDRDAIRAAIVASGHAHGAELRLAWISDTLHTGVIGVSQPLWEEARQRADLDVAGRPFPLPLGIDGRLTPLATVAGAVVV